MSPCRVGDVFEGGAGGGQKAGALRKELGDLERAEKCLDELILSSTAQLKQLTEYEDNQRYPLHAAPCSSTCPLGALHDLHGRAVLTLDPTLHAGLRDVSGHPLHWQSPGSDSHCCQGSSRHKTGGSRHRGGEVADPECLERVRVVTNSEVCDFLWQGSLQIYLKSKNGPIEVYLCPEEALEDASPVKSACTPKKDCPQTTTSTAPPSCSIKEEPVESKPGSGSILKYVENSRFFRNY